MLQSIGRDGAGITASRTGNRDDPFHLVIDALVAAVAVLGYPLYETKKESTGVHINLGERAPLDREQVAGRAPPESVGWAKAAARPLPQSSAAVAPCPRVGGDSICAAAVGTALRALPTLQDEGSAGGNMVSISLPCGRKGP
jgi:hypothetical protein